MAMVKNMRWKPIGVRKMARRRRAAAPRDPREAWRAGPRAWRLRRG